MKRIIATTAFAAVIGNALAQDQPEYRMDFGAGIALATYQGDFNSNLMKRPQPMASVVARYKMNPRSAWALNIGYTNLKGEARGEDTFYPVLTEENRKFKSSVVDVQTRYEYNFFPYGTGRDYHGAKRLTPMLTLGLGLSFAGKDGSSAGLQMPWGVGVKYKVRDRWNLTLELVEHFTANDRIDGQEDPYGIKSSGIFKNTDCYTTLQLSLTYDFWEKCGVCHNDDF